MCFGWINDLKSQYEILLPYNKIVLGRGVLPTLIVWSLTKKLFQWNNFSAIEHNAKIHLSVWFTLVCEQQQQINDPLDLHTLFVFQSFVMGDHCFW